MPLYSNPIIKRKTLHWEWGREAEVMGEGGAWCSWRSSCLQHVSTFALGKHKLPTHRQGGGAGNETGQEEIEEEEEEEEQMGTW